MKERREGGGRKEVEEGGREGGREGGGGREWSWAVEGVSLV